MGNGDAPKIAGVNDGTGIAITDPAKQAEGFATKFGRGLRWATFIAIVAGATAIGAAVGNAPGAAGGAVVGTGIAAEVVGDPREDPKPAPPATQKRLIETQATSEGGGVGK